jgi:hypothetical protein
MTARPLFLRDASSGWRELDDGRRQLVVWRRVSGAEGGWLELTFDGDDEQACEAEYARYCGDSAARSQRQHERRQRWGPNEIGRAA